MGSIRSIGLVFILVAATARAAVVDGDLTINSFVPYSGQTNLVLQATGNITFTGGTLTLPNLPPGATSGLLLVEAGTDIVVNDGVTIIGGAGWSVAMIAGTTNFDQSSPPISGKGNINFLGTASLVLTDGSLNLSAGNSIAVATGAIGDTGGNISLAALAGNVSAGSGGQIGTIGGGVVSISAGGTVSGAITQDGGAVTNITAGGIVAIPIGGCPSNKGWNGQTFRGYRYFDNRSHVSPIFLSNGWYKEIWWSTSKPRLYRP